MPLLWKLSEPADRLDRRPLGLQRVSIASLLAVTLACAFGCQQKGPEVVPVEGTVTRGGKPVAHLYMTFQPNSGRPSWAVTDENGHFQTNYGKDPKYGVRVGIHKVFVQYKVVSMAEEMGQAPSKAPKDIGAITAKYGRYDTTPLEFEITEATKDLKIELD